MRKKVYSFTIALFLLFSSLFTIPTFAASKKSMTFDFEAYLYSKTEQKMVPSVTFRAGETVYIAVSVSQISGIGGFTVSIPYDTALFSLEKSKAVCLISDAKSEYLLNSSNGKVLLIWETTSTDTAIEGLVFYVPLLVSDRLSGDQNYSFAPKIVEAFESDRKQTSITATVGETPSVTCKAIILPQDFIDAVGALSDLHYNPTNNSQKPADSLAAIDSALEQYRGLSVEQQNMLYSNFRDLYDLLSTARNRYYELAASEKQKLIQNEADTFLSTYAALLALDPENVTLDKADAIENLEAAYKIVSTPAKEKIPDADKEKVSALVKAIAALKNAKKEQEAVQEETDEFLNDYGMWLKDDVYQDLLDGWDVTYSSYAAYIQEAQTVYNNLLSAAAQKQLSVYGERMETLLKLAVGYADDAAAEEELLAKIAAFQKAYLPVFVLNDYNVSITDKSAIEMVIDAYEQLEDEEMKKRLSGRISGFKELLNTISALTVIDNQTPDTPTATPTVIIKEVEVPVAGEPAGASEPEIRTNTVTKTVKQVLKEGLRTPFIILCILLAMSVFSLAISAFLSQAAQNKKKGDGKIE